jgi:ElaB/YqjD/DUF883 family membrane-anchored ribosome-binding protein
MPDEKRARKNRKRTSPASSVSPVKKSSASATVRGAAKKPDSKEENIMADENKTTEGAADTPQAQDEIQRSAAHARKAAESLRSAAGAVADEYRGRAEEVWQDASNRVRSFQDDAEQYVRDNPTKAIFTAVGVGFVLGLIFRR